MDAVGMAETPKLATLPFPLILKVILEGFPSRLSETYVPIAKDYLLTVLG
ncbi:hypothetical protein [cyanobacterium endosymbiont of Rhopalodia gibberula]|nr:hypothetical protein [cyanobacterium endosymbiont of Rhopalodia gibberula]